MINKGYSQTKEHKKTRRKEKVPFVCQYCGKVTYTSRRLANIRKYCSQKCHYADGPSDEARKNMRDNRPDQLGKNNPMFGKHGKDNPNYGSKRTQKVKDEMSRSRMGENSSMYGKENKWGRHKLESIEKMRQTTLQQYREKPMLQKTKDKIGKSNSGENNGMYGKTGDKNPIHGKGYKLIGNKNGMWQNGKSFELYPAEFNNQLKELIRKRDNYRCQQCFRHQDELYSKNGRKYKLSVHHIDYDKKNNDPTNLIALCSNCHAQTNYKRKDWINYFNNTNVN